MKNSGYTKNWRSIWFNELFQNADGSYRCDYHTAWRWMIDKAQFKTNGIGRGQLRCSEALLAKLFFCSKRRKARTFRAICEANNMLIWDPQPGQQMAIVTICNYEKYQGSENENDQQPGQQPPEKRPTKRPLLEEGRRNKKKEKEYTFEFLKFWEAYPAKRGSKFKASQALEKALKAEEFKTIMQAVTDKCGGLDAEEKYIPHATTWLNGKRWQAVPSQRAQKNQREIQSTSKLAELFGYASGGET